MRAALIVLTVLASLASAFVMPTATQTRPAVSRTVASPVMMGKMAQDGPFTPVVLAAKVVLGEKLLNKIRGKAISYHSQFISEFCYEFGVPNKMVSSCFFAQPRPPLASHVLPHAKTVSSHCHRSEGRLSRRQRQRVTGSASCHEFSRPHRAPRTNSVRLCLINIASLS